VSTMTGLNVSKAHVYVVLAKPQESMKEVNTPQTTTPASEQPYQKADDTEG
jgi:hypothetical protein